MISSGNFCPVRREAGKGVVYPRESADGMAFNFLWAGARSGASSPWKMDFAWSDSVFADLEGGPAIIDGGDVVVLHFSDGTALAGEKLEGSEKCRVLPVILNARKFVYCGFGDPFCWRVTSREGLLFRDIESGRGSRLASVVCVSMDSNHAVEIDAARDSPALPLFSLSFRRRFVDSVVSCASDVLDAVSRSGVPPAFYRRHFRMSCEDIPGLRNFLEDIATFICLESGIIGQLAIRLGPATVRQEGDFVHDLEFFMEPASEPLPVRGEILMRWVMNLLYSSSGGWEAGSMFAVSGPGDPDPEQCRVLPVTGWSRPGPSAHERLRLRALFG